MEDDIVDDTAEDGDPQVATQYASPASMFGHVGESTAGFQASNVATEMPNCAATLLHVSPDTGTCHCVQPATTPFCVGAGGATEAQAALGVLVGATVVLDVVEVVVVVLEAGVVVLEDVELVLETLVVDGTEDDDVTRLELVVVVVVGGTTMVL